MEVHMAEIKFNYDLGLFGDTMHRVIMRDYPHRAGDFVESFLSNQVNSLFNSFHEINEYIEYSEFFITITSRSSRLINLSTIQDNAFISLDKNTSELLT